MLLDSVDSTSTSVAIGVGLGVGLERIGARNEESWSPAPSDKKLRRGGRVVGFEVVGEEFRRASASGTSTSFVLSLEGMGSRVRRLGTEEGREYVELWV